MSPPSTISVSHILGLIALFGLLSVSEWFQAYTKDYGVVAKVGRANGRGFEASLSARSRLLIYIYIYIAVGSSVCANDTNFVVFYSMLSVFLEANEVLLSAHYTQQPVCDDETLKIR